VADGPSQPVFTADDDQAARELIRLGLQEDLGERGDVTSQTLIDAGNTGTVQIVARRDGVLAGLPVAERVFEAVDRRVVVKPFVQDGASLAAGTVVADVSGPVRALLTGERTALNFLTHLSGVATLTRRFVNAIAGTRAVILDTRKTLPGYRRLQKYAVRCGGGTNHRLGLFDAILIKDNHLAAWSDGGRDIADAVRFAREQAPAGVTVEVEVDTLAQLERVLPAGPSIVLLDNMSADEMRQAAERRNRIAPRVRLEASGGVTLETVLAIAETGVDRISIGALTHSAPALDLAFDWRR
jgi:nicotinate-nucleotide pyrophosphorylase (carboxylating)